MKDGDTLMRMLMAKQRNGDRVPLKVHGPSPLQRLGNQGRVRGIEQQISFIPIVYYRTSNTLILLCLAKISRTKEAGKNSDILRQNSV